MVNIRGVCVHRRRCYPAIAETTTIAPAMVATLSSSEVLSIYEVVVRDFVDSGDPVSPVGVKSMSLLESAVSRQHTGFDGHEKYSTPALKAATLAYGICCDHPFHNGNKRTALVAMLCHLDKNDLTFQEGVTQEALYELMKDVAGHELVRRPGIGDYSDEEVANLARWVRQFTRRVETTERIITCRELHAILRRHNFDIDNFTGNHADVVRYKRPLFGWGAGGPKRERIIRIPWPRDGAQVGRGILKELRDKCGLTDADGVDSVIFYTKTRPADYFVNKYRKTLRSLAKT